MEVYLKSFFTSYEWYIQVQHPRTHEEKIPITTIQPKKKKNIIANINGQNKQLDAI